ncbi:lipopolysaccharide biosynthesis protein [Marivirga salinae]|uniref:Lipopolysaccharide biosynthesis protein n=1 Tax=Marivirga salinarum TaxID=3059078 RepID=A0AA49J8H1_9BACT|nr:lipopolysaccharide biosynthesis protein [Marivirga sp. BDSF4-3]WKK74525.2 lipopolysaccharide biosynthesis protein [Marivirga sp. BDSF4-3]
MLKKLFSHTAIYGLAPQITKVASFFSLPLITQELTELDYGVAGVLTAYTSALAVLSILGMRVVLVNAFFKSPQQYKWGWRQIYGFLTMWNIVYGILLGALIFLIVPSEANDDRLLITVLHIGPIIFFGPTANICSTYYQLRQKPLQIAVRSIIFGFLAIGLNILFIVYYKMGYMGWFWSAFLVGIFNNLSFYYPLNYILKLKPIFNFKWRYLKSSLKVSLPMVPHYYSGYLLENSDKMVMDLSGINTGNIGKYNVAYTVGKFTNSLGMASGLAIGPMLIKYYKEGNDLEASRLVFILQIAFFCITTLLSLWMKEAFAFLIRNEVLASMYYLGIIIVMAYNYRPMYLGFSTKTMYNEKTSIMWRVTFGAGIINVLLNVILLPIYGFEVAAITTFIAYMFMGYAGYYFKMFKEINTISYYPILWLGGTVVSTIFVFFAVELLVLYKLIISFLIITVGGFAIYFLNRKLNGLSK